MRAGFASTIITPAPGIAMAGYGTRTEGALGTHDELEARAVWLEDDGTRVALVSLDLVGVDTSLTRGAAARLADVLPAESLVLCATHTHAGPVVIRDRIGSRADQPGADRVAPEIEACVERAVREARRAAREAVVGFAAGEVSALGANRRREDGPMDPSVGVLSLREPDGHPIAALVRYSCHPTVLDASNRLYSAEYPGAARREIRQRAGVPVLFLNGSAGDVSTRFTRRESTFEEVERFGHILADEAVRLLATSSARETAPLAFATRAIALPTRALPSREQAERAQDEAEQRFERLRASGASRAETRGAETALFGARRTLTLVREGLRSTVEATLAALQLGPATLVTLPGEPFTEVAREVARRAGEALLMIGYANGYVGYLPTPGEKDGYEIGASVVSSEGVEMLIAAAADLARDVRRQASIDREELRA